MDRDSEIDSLIDALADRASEVDSLTKTLAVGAMQAAAAVYQTEL